MIFFFVISQQFKNVIYLKYTKVMTVPLIFSLFAVVVVSIVTIYVGTNRIQHTKTKNNLHSTKILNDSRYEEQQQKLQNLVNAINHNDTDLNKFTNNVNKNFVKLEKNTKHDISDMKNSIKNYQHINSANMLGIDKRMSENYSFLDNQHHNFKTHYNIKKQEQDANIERNRMNMDEHKKDYSDYKLFMERQQHRQDQEAMMFRDDLQESLTGNINKMASNLDEASRNIITQIDAKYEELDNRVRTYYVHRDGNNSNINDAINNYYFFNNDFGFTNITNMNDLLQETDVGINHIYENSNNIYKHKTILDGLKHEFDTDGLRKSTFDNWIQDTNGPTYQKIIANEDHIRRLETKIGANIEKITDINEAIELINQTDSTQFKHLTDMIKNNRNTINALYNSNLTLIQSNIRIQNSNINYKTSFQNIQDTLLEKEDGEVNFNDINVRKLTFVDTDTNNKDGKSDILTKFGSLGSNIIEIKTSISQTSNYLNSDINSRIPRKMFVNPNSSQTMINDLISGNNTDTDNMFTYLEYDQSVKFQNNVDFNGSISMDFNKLQNTENDEPFVSYVNRIATDSTINRNDMMRKLNNTSDSDSRGKFILSNVEIDDKAATIKTNINPSSSLSDYVQEKINNTLDRNNTINNAWMKNDPGDNHLMKDLIYNGGLSLNRNHELLQRLGEDINEINLNGELNIKGPLNVNNEFNIDANIKPTFKNPSGEIILGDDYNNTVKLSDIQNIPSISEMNNFDNQSVNDKGFKHTVNGKTTYYKFPQLHPVSLQNFVVDKEESIQKNNYDINRITFNKMFNQVDASQSHNLDNVQLELRDVTKHNIIKELNDSSIDLSGSIMNIDKLKIGNICLKSTGDDTLKVCDNKCDNCHDVWHHGTAPPPTNT